MVLGYFAAGWLNQYYGWRVMFVAIGLPGLVLAVLSCVTLKDPRFLRGPRLLRGNGAERPPVQETLRDVCLMLWKRKTFRSLLYSCAVNWFFSYGTLQWTPTFFVRSFGLTTGVLGTAFAFIIGVGSIVGTYWGGEWAARKAPGNEQRQLLAMMVVTCLSGLFMACVYVPWIAPNSYWAFTWLGLANLLGATINGPQFAMIQTLVPERMRATAISLVYLFANLIGIGLGPWAAGALSDALNGLMGGESLRYAMLLLCPGFVWSAWYFWTASRTITGDLLAVQTGPDDVATEHRRVSAST